MKQTLLLALVLLSVNLVPCETALQFDRHAVDDGELWRLLTGSWVHFSWGHMALDLAVILIAALMIGRRSWAIVGAASLATGLGVYLFTPDVVIYRGLSGVSVGMVAVLVVEKFRETRHPAFAVGGVILAAKLAIEMITGQFLFPTVGMGDMGDPIPVAHVAGAVGALLLAPTLWMWLPVRGPSPQPVSDPRR